MTLLGYSVPETLTDDAGRPQKGKTLAVTGPDDYAGVAVSDSATGVVRLGPLPVGVYTVSYGDRSALVPVFPTPDDMQVTYDAATAAAPAGDVTAETAARIAADAAEESARVAAVTAEVAARTAALAAEAATRAATDSTDADDDSAEVAARIAADAAEVTARQVADSAESAARAALDAREASNNAAQATAIGDETTARTNAVAAEASARAAADSSLQASITANTSALALKAPLASPAFTGTPTLGGSPLLTQASATGTFPPIGFSRAARGLVERLSIGAECPAALILGDSTGAYPSVGDSVTSRFFTRSMLALAAKFPAYSVNYLNWSDTLQGWEPPTMPQVGTAGDRYIRFSSGVGFLTAPDSAATSVTGDLDVRVKVGLDDWTPSAQAALCSKQDGAGARSWRLELQTNGRPMFSWTTDGTNLIDKSATAAVPFADGAVGWVRATLDVDNGATGSTVTFYTSTLAKPTDNPADWTQLGTAVVTAGVTSIADTTALNYFPGRTSGGYNPGGINCYELQVRAGINGTPVIICDLDALPDYPVASFTGYTGSVWTVNNPGPAQETRAGAKGFLLLNGSAPSQAIAYANNGTRFALLTPYPADIAFINFSQNENTTVSYRAVYKQLTDAIIAKYPDCKIIATIQSKRLSPASNIVEHDIRNGQIAALAAGQDFAVLDMRTAFGSNPATYLNADGVHPTTAGDILLAQEVALRHLSPWTQLAGLGAVTPT